MKFKCQNCGQSYNTKNLPPNADPSLCPYCGHSVARLPLPVPAGKTKPGKASWLRPLVILALFAIPAVINYLEELRPSGEKEEAPPSELSAYLAGYYLMEAEERYYDQKNTYTSDLEQLHSVTRPLDIEEGVTVTITHATDSSFHILAMVDRSERAFSFQQTHPLHRAARSGDVEKIKALIAGGADMNALDVSMRTPLFYARFYNHPEADRFLLSLGALEQGR